MARPGDDFWKISEPPTGARERMQDALVGGEAAEPMVRSFLLSTFLQMAVGVIVSAIAATVVAVDPNLERMLTGPGGLTVAGWAITLAPLGLVLLLGTQIDRLSAGRARMIFLGYAALVGLSLSTIFLDFAPASVAVTFIAAAAGFCALAFVGSRIGRDLNAFGSFLTIMLVGLVCLAAVTLFLHEIRLEYGLAIAGVLLFAGLTAVDTQRLKRLFDQRLAATAGNVAVLGALTLYLDLLNLFVSALRLTGRRR